MANEPPDEELDDELGEIPADEQAAVFQFTEEQPQRLDKFLVSRIPDFSRSRLQALIKDGLVTIDGQTAHKAGVLLEAPSQVEVRLPAPRPSDLQPENIPLNIVFENDDLMVINKPAGMVVHPAAGHYSGTLVHAALAHAPKMEGVGGEQRPGVVHRLDKDTSGLIVLAKNDQTHRWLVDQFKERKVNKTYLALVDGAPPTPAGRIETPIGRSPVHRQMMAVVPADKGRPSITEYRTLEKFPKHTLLEVHPLTGRMHQIRIHLQFIGCPVAGDKVYGHKHPSIPLERQFLHAARLTFTLRGEVQPRTFEAPLPADLQDILNTLRRDYGIH